MSRHKPAPATHTAAAPQPSVGRIVHYCSHGSPVQPDGTQQYKPECRAAIITAVEDPAGQAGGGIVSLAVLNPEGMFFKGGVSYVHAEHVTGGSWHWPEQV
jgi:hypothetical protein